MALSVHQYSQLCYIVETLSLGLTLMFIGVNRIKMVPWLARIRRATALALLIASAATVLLFALDLETRHNNIDKALSITTICVITFIFSIAFLPQSKSVHMTRSSIMTTLLLFLLSIILAWTSTLTTGDIPTILIVAALGVYLIELVRITLAFWYKHMQQHNKQEIERLDSVVKTIILLFAMSILYVFIMMLPQSFRTLHNLCMLVVWAVLFVSCINLIMNSTTDTAIQITEEDTSHPGQSSPQPLPHAELASRVERWVRSHNYCDPDVTLNSAARALDTNRTYLSQYINSRHGCNFSTWITRLRLSHAKRLMCDSPTLSVDEVARAVGFASTSYFIKSFKAVEGVSPGQWRKHVS